MTVTFAISAFAEAAKTIKPLPGGAGGGVAGIAIYNHAWMQVTAGEMTLAMSNLDQEARAAIDCDGPDVAVLLPMAVLDFFLSRGEAGEGTLTFDADLRSVVCRHGRARLTMPVLRATDFYLMDLATQTWSLTAQASTLSRAMNRVQVAASTHAAQPHLQGVFLHVLDGALTLAATDSGRVHAAAVTDAELQGAMPRAGDSELPGVILPNRMIREFSRLFGDDESRVTIRGNANMLAVEGARLRLASKLISGIFPPWQKVVPTLPGAAIEVDASRLTKAIAAVLVEDRTDAKGKRLTSRKIKLTYDGSGLVVAARGDSGDAEDQIDASASGVPSGTWMQFNADFVRGAIDVAAAARIRLHPPEEIGKPMHVSVEASGLTLVLGQQGGYL